MIFLSGTTTPKTGIETESFPSSFDLQFRGFITGSSIRSRASGQELCRYIGGIPYALPPVGPHRFHRPQELPPCYQYGTKASPGDYTGDCNVCPQQRTSKLDSEDCLQLNVYIPTGPPPREGWPVYFYIHGGYLQFGSANEINPVAMLSETSFRAIIVMPAYRLNVYGFLASQELLYESTNRSGTVGNMGFWDQRLALQWTYTNISYFQGNPSNITVAGYSAGSHSVFYQLAYDLDYPPEKRIIKRVCMHANGPGVQPKSLQEHQEHFEELLVVLKISTALPASEKLKRLRETKPATFRKATNKMRLHQFRAVTDGHFVKDDLFQRLEDGTFAKKLLESNVEILIGESVNEHHMYANHYTPKNNPEAVYKRLLADYPKWAVDKLREVYFQDGSLPAGVKSWRELFGRIYADIQVHASERGFVDALIRGGAGDLIHRYHIAWRSDVTWSAKKFGATHWSDNVIWFFGDGKSLPETEKVMVRSAFLDQYSKFVRGEAIDWQTNGPLQIRRLVDNGKIEIWQDEWWEEKLRVWKALQTAMPKAKLGLRSSL